MLPPYKRKPRLRTYKKGSQTEFGNHGVKTLDSNMRGNDKMRQSCQVSSFLARASLRASRPTNENEYLA